MAELPFELQKLPPAALDVLRYFSQNGNQPADEIDIMDGADLTERSFSKAIKRLVTKKFAEMDISRMYTLTDKGVGLMEELVEYDRASGGGSPAPAAQPEPTVAAPVQCRMTVVAPEPMLAGAEVDVFVGLDDSVENAELLVRLSLLNGSPDMQEDVLRVGNGASHAAFRVAVGEYTQMRLRLQAYQADEFSGEMHSAGGMYVDLDITNDQNEKSQLAAFGTDVTVQPM